VIQRAGPIIMIQDGVVAHDLRGNPPRLVFSQQFGRRSAPLAPPKMRRLFTGLRDRFCVIA
jgi:hypothetical protein